MTEYSEKHTNKKKDILKNIFLCGGGTGGHIYPGLALIPILKKNGFNPIFVGAKRPLDKKILSKSGSTYELVLIAPLNTSNIFKKIWSMLLIPISLFQSLYFIIKHRPVYVIGFGGYAAFPTLTMAWILKIPTAIWEANAYPGLVSRWMANKANLIFLSLEDDRGIYPKHKTHIVGVPTRFEAKPNQQQDVFQVLIFGGSSGARAINEVVSDFLISLSKESPLKKIHFVHQIGSLDFSYYRDKYKKHAISVDVREFIHDMAQEYAKSNLVICRSGASTLSELAVSKKAAILVPLPWAADNHQYLNARKLSDKGAAVLIEQKDFSVKKIDEILLDLSNNNEKLSELSMNISKFSHVDAGKKIVDLIARELK